MENVNSGMWLIIIVGSLFLAINWYYNYKKRQKAMQMLSYFKQLEKVVVASVENKTKIENFLEEASFSEGIGKRNDKIVYKYIKNNNLIFKFKDFLPKEKDIEVFNDEALIFNGMHYERDLSQ